MIQVKFNIGPSLSNEEEESNDKSLLENWLHRLPNLISQFGATSGEVRQIQLKVSL
jgi:hypothetical protein